MNQKVIVAGVGMIPFTKPGASEPYHVMGEKAVRQAMADARVEYPMIQQAYVGYVYGDSTCGQRALYPVGMSGIPIVNVNNNCSTGSSALFLARQAIQSGADECVLALSYEQIAAGLVGRNKTGPGANQKDALNRCIHHAAAFGIDFGERAIQQRRAHQNGSAQQFDHTVTAFFNLAFSRFSSSFSRTK